MAPGTEVQWHDGQRARRGKVIREDSPGYFAIEGDDGMRFVLPAGRLTVVTD